MRHLVFLLSVPIALSLSCARSTTNVRRSIELETPKVSAGVIAPEASGGSFNKAIAVLERSANRPTRSGQPSPIEPPSNETGAIKAIIAPQYLPVAGRTDIDFPTGAGRLIALGKLSATELDELVDSLLLKFTTEKGYAVAAPAIADMLPSLPKGVARGDVLARSTDEGLRLLRMGYRLYLSQPAQLWVYGVEMRSDSIIPNDDVEAVEPTVAATLESIKASQDSLTLSDLEAAVVQLSFVEASSALTALKGLGVTVIPAESKTLGPIDFAQLPLVSAMPGPADTAMALVGAGAEGEKGATRDERGMFAIPTNASKLGTETVAGPTSQLLVLFHPAHPEQHSRVLQWLTDLIDVPARQVFIEGMVVEISNEGLKDLGIEWEFQNGTAAGVFGALNAGLSADTLNFTNDDSVNLPGNWIARVRALVRDNKAEVLSRPSVITLDNRQATIRIGTDIPVATSQEGFGVGANKIAFDFRYLPTGILLNVRPRIDAQNKQISMQIDTTVSATVPASDLEIRDAAGAVLATAPTISSRRVQTYARIANNTPFIIGGLVSRENITVQDKIPWLGDLPVLGPLFRAERTQSNKREVIIVLTPYVLPERRRVDRTIPKSETIFDSFGHELFRDAYRLREGEVFDLSFLTGNPRLRRYKELANTAIRHNFRLAERKPFSLFAGDRIPAEHILVERMIYEIVKRLKLGQKIDRKRAIYFVQDEHAGYQVRFLEEFMRSHGDGVTMTSFFDANPGRALYMTYLHEQSPGQPGAMARDPIPEIGLIDCQSRKQWSELLWEMNQPIKQADVSGSSGRSRSTILVYEPKDLLRLQRAIAGRRIVQLNGGEANLRLSNFNVGTMIQVPDFRDDEVHVIDAGVARHFFHTEHYYSATTKRIERAIDDLDQALRAPDVRAHLDADAPQLPK